MTWNLLNYPDSNNPGGDTILRHPFYREVIQYVNPDILVTEENTSTTAVTWFLNTVMNVNGNVYGKGTFINGYDTNNEIYFKDSLFTFISNIRIRTDVRDINEFKLIHRATRDTIRIYAVHLKASSGSPNDAQRAEEVDSLRKVTNLLPAGSNFIVCGDFNIYGDYESAYQKLLQDNVTDDGNFVDPINMTGNWHYYPYRSYHTQSTRIRSFGTGSTGGLNDRFDMVLFSRAISQGLSRITYVPGSTIPVGNDGNHYNDSINMLPNTAAPASVINALYNASDHLPVYALFTFMGVTGLQSMETHSPYLTIYPNPLGEFSMLKYRINEASLVTIKVFDVLGKMVATMVDENKSAGEYSLPMTLSDHLEKGLYIIHLQTNKQFVSSNFIKY